MGGPGGRTRGAAIFDVDGTICATRSTTSLLWIRGRLTPPWRHNLWLATLTWKAPLAWMADQVNREWADGLVYRQFAGLPVAAVHEAARQCAEEVLLPSCFPQALEEMVRHRQEGRRIILLSSGVENILSPLSEALEAELLAQGLTEEGGRFTGGYRPNQLLDGPDEPPPSQRERKRRVLEGYAQKVGIDLSASWAFGDTINDAGMLEAVGNPVAVNPHPRLARLARKRGWEVRRWR